MNYEKIDNCPICQSSNLQKKMTCKDWTATGESFAITECTSCGFWLTNPRPQLSELGRYYDSPEYISHTNSSKGLLNRVYQIVRGRAIAAKLSLVEKENKSDARRLLDIGCGTGSFLGACKNAGWNVLGIEPSDSARKIAISEHGVEVKEESAIDTLPAASFDVITMWHVLEHVPALQERIAQLRRLLKPNGLIVIAVPNRNSADAKHYGACWAAYDVPRHLWHFRPQDIRALVAQHGLSVFHVKPMVFDAYYVSLLSEKYKAGRMRPILALWNGWRSNASAGNEQYSSQIYLIRPKPQTQLV